MRVDEGAGPPASTADMITPGEGRSRLSCPEHGTVRVGNGDLNQGTASS